MRNNFREVTGIFIVAALVLCMAPPDLFAQQGVAPSNIMLLEDEQIDMGPETVEVSGTESGNVTVDFKNADIQTVLRVLSLKSGVNIVAAENVRGTVTIKLVDVPWDVALETILKTYSYAYERIGNVVSVGRVKDLTDQKKELQELFEVQPVVVEVFTLKHLNAGDVLKVITPLLSKRGKASVLYRKGQKGWAYARLGLTKGETAASGERETVMRPGEEDEDIMSRTLVVIDIPPYVDKIRRTIDTMDSIPKQVFIETRIVEVRRDKLVDLGLDISTGTVSTFKLNPVDHSQAGASMYTGNNSPQPFRPQSDGIKGTSDAATKLFNTGLNLVYKKLGGFEFEVIMHALEEDVDTNVLSAPKIRTLENQEASILIGTKYPILKSSSESTTGTTTTAAELDYYQDIGIQLLVVPQVNEDGFINMIVHPIVSNITGYVQANIGTTTTTPIQYPIIQAREAQTQVLMKTGETVVIGGLLLDAKSKGREGVPFFKDIPLLGLLFSRDTKSKSKIDLLIFITAYVLDENSNEIKGRDKTRLEHARSLEKQSEIEAIKSLPPKRKEVTGHQ